MQEITVSQMTTTKYKKEKCSIFTLTICKNTTRYNYTGTNIARQLYSNKLYNLHVFQVAYIFY